MPSMRKVPEALYTKNIIFKGYGFNTPQERSVCKIKVTVDAANLLTGLDKEKSKEIIIGDCDGYIDCLIEDCIKTMKDKEECCIQFKQLYAETDISLDCSADSCKDDNTDISCESSKDDKMMNVSFHDNISDDQCSLSESISCSNIKSDNIKISEHDKTIPSNLKPETVPINLNKKFQFCNTDKNVHMLKIQFKLLSFTVQPDIWEVNVAEKWKRANHHKQRGLELYASRSYQYSFRRFGLALKYIISVEHDEHTDREDMDIKGLKLSCYLNMAACQMHHHNFELVVINATKALALQPNNPKALYRRGVAYLQLQDYEKSEEDLKAVQQLEPNNQTIAKQLLLLKDRVRKLNQHYANAMKKMFS